MTDTTEHLTMLKKLWMDGPFNAFFSPTVEISEGEATVSFEVEPQYHIITGSAHGSIYFKILDDAATLAANSISSDGMLLTVSFNTYINRPVRSGILRAEGKVVSQSKNLIIAESVAFDEKGREVARGSGSFMKSSMPIPS